MKSVFVKNRIEKYNGDGDDDGIDEKQKRRMKMRIHVQKHRQILLKTE